MNQQKPSLYFDAINYYLAPHRGMAKFTREFISVLKSSSLFDQIIGTVPTKIGKKGELSADLLLIGHSNAMIYEQISLPILLKNSRPTFYLFPYNTAPIFPVKGVKYIIVVHDLIFMEPFSKIPLPKNLWQILGRYYRRWIVPLSIKNAHSIITVSEHSKSKIMEKFHISPNKIVVIPNSTAHLLPINQQETVLKKKTILCVGGDSPNKNILFLILGYGKLPKKLKAIYPLQIAGLRHQKNIDFLSNLIFSNGDSDYITILPPLSNEELTNSYLESSIFVFPSLDEGFGIPLLEAMYYGCKVVCSNASSFPEICGEAAFYFNPSNEESLVDALLTCIENEEEGKLKLEKAKDRLSLFSQDVFKNKVTKWAIDLLS